MKILLLFILCFYINISFSQNDFNKDWLKCIVELQKKDSAGNYYTHGTGFCLYNYKGGNFTYLVTCAHVLRNSYIYVRVPSSDSATSKLGILNTSINIFGREWQYDGFSFTTKVDLIKDQSFVVNDSLDIGIVKFPYSSLVFMSPKDTINLVDLKKISNSRIKRKNDIEVGSNVYFVGFPFGIGSANGYVGINGITRYSDVKINPLVRSGIIAWKSEQISEFLLDGVSYNGNSGSPIFTKDDRFGQYHTSLIGMVLGHINDQTVKGVDINQNLVRCIWIDEILKLQEQFK